MTRRRNKPGKGAAKEQEQFIRHAAAMRKWSEFQKLGLRELRFLFRLELEYLNHWRDNGRLTVSHRQFEAAGVRRRSITAAKKQLTDLGLVEVTRAGRAHAELRDSGQYRLTYLPTYLQEGLTTNEIPPTHEWKRVAKK
jgi:hypothetical protein